MFLLRYTVVMGIALFAAFAGRAQNKEAELGMDYVTEVQHNFENNKSNWVNLFSFHVRVKPWESGVFSIQTISTYKTYKEYIANDLQKFSNIENENMGINIFKAGYTHSFDNIELFAGLRNVNLDYFTGDYTGLFTNGSCGIYPTIATNFPIANYPLSAMCLHGAFQVSDNIQIQSSFYNGVARSLLESGGGIFSINPAKDGIFNMTEASYKSESKYYSLYTIGFALHSRYTLNETPQKLNQAIWAGIEQCVYKSGPREIGFMLQGSIAPLPRNDCRYYYGVGFLLHGFLFQKKPDSFGFFIDKAEFAEALEMAIEVTWKYELFKHLTIQPTFSHILTGNRKNTVALLRFYFSLHSYGEDAIDFSKKHF